VKRLIIAVAFLMLLVVCVVSSVAIKHKDAEIATLKQCMAALAEEVVDLEIQRQEMKRQRQAPTLIGLPDWWEYCI
jgi:hypothetical protein